MTVPELSTEDVKAWLGKHEALLLDVREAQRVPTDAEIARTTALPEDESGVSSGATPRSG